MSVFIPSGYGDRHLADDYRAFVTFCIREPLKTLAQKAFAGAAPTLHIYNAHTHEHWHAANDEGHLKQLLKGFGKGSMVVVARGDEDTPESHAQHEQLAQDLRQEGLIQNSDQFLVVRPARQTQLNQGPLVSHLQMS